MRIEVAGSTHVGMKRAHNEDNYLLLPEERLFCVADGMGGHASGEVASKIAVEEIADFFRASGRDQELTWPYKMDKSRSYDENRLATGIKLANSRIYERASGEVRYRGMGTTIASVHFTSEATLLGHVGDSRVYRFRAGKLEQLTEDHSLLNDYIKARKLTPEEIESFPHKNVILRALGMKDTVEVEVNHVDPKDGDIYLVCSDGLSGMVSDDQMESVLTSAETLQQAVSTLIERANHNGGVDNITCVLARYWSS